MVGTLRDVGLGKKQPEDINYIIQKIKGAYIQYCIYFHKGVLRKYYCKYYT